MSDNRKVKLDMILSAGTSFTNWMRVLYMNKFKVDFKYIPRNMMVISSSLLFMPFIFIERLLYDRKIKNTPVKEPLFIIGHMRSGTTFLHYLFSKDDRYTYSTTADSVFPWVFLTLNKVVRTIVTLTMPDKRPMDNMMIGADYPQEEEFAIANICPYSPNNGAYFIRHIEDWYKNYSLFDGVSEKVKNKWKKYYRYYLQKLILKSGGKQVLSKSLVNSGRMNLLLEMFPDARFVFIYRNPYKVFLSTKKLYNNFILKEMNYQDISQEELENKILHLAKSGLEKYCKDKTSMPKGTLSEVQFEKLVKDPMGEMNRIYDELNISGFEKVKAEIEIMLQDYKDYKEDTYNIDDNLKKRIREYFNVMFENYGYE